MRSPLPALGRSWSSLGMKLTLMVVTATLAVIVAILVYTTVATQLGHTPEIRAVKCLTPWKDESCPQYGAALKEANAQLRAVKSEARQAEKATERAKAEADAAEARLTGLRDVQDITDELTLFVHHAHGGRPNRITVATHYTQLVPPSPNPKHSCYIDLGNAETGEARNYWYKHPDRTARIRDRRAERETLGISDDLFEQAKRVCHPTLIGGGNG